MLIWDGGKLFLMFKEERCYQQRLWKGFHLIFLSQMLQVHFMTIFCSREDCDFFLLACTFSKVCIFFLKNYMHQILWFPRVYLPCIIHYFLFLSFLIRKMPYRALGQGITHGRWRYELLFPSRRIFMFILF